MSRKEVFSFKLGSVVQTSIFNNFNMEFKMAKKKKNLMTRLKGLQKSWKKATPRQAGMVVPEDNYPVRVVSAILEEAKSTGRLQINWDLEILDGDYKGKHVHKYAGVDNEDNLDYVQGDFETLELEIPDSIADIGEVLEAAQGLVLDIRVRKADEFINIDFLELLEGYEEEEEDEDEESEDKDEDEESEDKEEDDDDDDDEEEEEEDEEEEITEDDIGKMKSKALLTVIKDYDLEVEDAEDMKVSELRKAVIGELFE